jgi:hypothetical protein
MCPVVWRVGDRARLLVSLIRSPGSTPCLSSQSTVTDLLNPHPLPHILPVLLAKGTLATQLPPCIPAGMAILPPL